ncbi:glutathione S-transferase N-terminal domain-containing protein [Polynucleobacter sp. AM-26B4]|jgi:glutathione S-transferase|uniref:glutathione S-transferase N-terminal domain-containing protein n=1 Tax=Polynucleobacter sp. AM-26B4 TaxID=2689103 RepID=UPI001C0B3BF3|nr:glutathione S-transferase N-terminal domain-containing protein [Polynucleobacter sp. AM-26B4]MBU3585659.1 glutathione S-transferase N-terminal domain-containing protein [Polynucleobacter sp. AM-26B4]
MKLIGSLTSPYVRKARIVFAEKKIEVPLIQENVWSQDTKIMQANPLGKVPCLVMDDGGAMFDSRVIVEYADTLSPVNKLIPASGKEKAAVKTWEALADGILDASVLARLEATWRPDEQKSQAWIDRQLHKVDVSLKAMSNGLGESEWCFGNQISLADISVGCALDYLIFRFPNNQWQKSYPNLNRLYKKLMSRPSFANTAPPQ